MRRVAAVAASASGEPARPAAGHARFLKSFGRRTLVEWCLLYAGVMALVAAVAQHDWAERADLAVYDIAIGAQHHAARDDIVIVAIDDASITAIGRWPWRRTVLASLVDHIAAGKPRVIGVDVILSERDTRYPQDDAVLARSFAAAGNVILPALAEHSGGAMLVRYPLAGLGAGVGHINMTVDADGVARQVFLLEGPQPADAAGLPHLAAVMAGFGQPPRLPGSYRHEAAQTIDAFGWERRFRLRIPYAGPPGTFTRVPVLDVLEGRADPAIFHGKTVLVGAMATALGDVLPTPVSRDGRGMSGVEILANTLQSLLAGDAIVRVSPAWFWLGTLSAVLLAALAVLCLTPRGALVATAVLIAGMLGGSLLLVGQASLWFPPAAAVLGCLLCYPLWSWRRQETALRFLSDELARLEREPGLLPAPPSIGASLDSRMRSVYRMSARLRDMRRFLSDGLESLPEATAICDLDGAVLLANRRCVALAPDVPGVAAAATEGGRPEIRAVVAALFAAPAQALEYWESLRRAYASPHARQASDTATDDGVELVARDGRCYLLHGAPLHGEHGAVAGLIVSFIDITMIRLAERQREQMLRFLSHDMRSPQASILALIDLHGRDGDGAAPSTDLLPRIGAHASRTMSLADDFIRLARAESQYLNFVEVDLTGLVLDASDELWALARTRGVELKLDVPNDEAVMLAEPALLVRAIANLISNAIKFSPRGEAVTVSLRHAAGAFEIAVADHGPGIGEADQARLFQPFARLHENAPDAPPGSGLGLVFVRTVVERHGGRVTVRSAAGAGATFTIVLRAP